MIAPISLSVKLSVSKICHTMTAAIATSIMIYITVNTCKTFQPPNPNARYHNDKEHCVNNGYHKRYERIFVMVKYLSSPTILALMVADIAVGGRNSPSEASSDKLDATIISL